MPKISQIDHIALVSHDFQESISFFKKLGLLVSHEEILEDRGIKTAMIPIGEITLELISPLHEKSEVSKFLAKKGPGIHHIALKTLELEKTMKSLQDQDIPFTTQAPSQGAGEKKVAFIHPKSAQGVLIELCEQSDKN